MFSCVLVAPLVFYDFMFVFTQTNKSFTPTDLSDSATTDFGFKQTKIEPQSSQLHIVQSKCQV